MDVSEIYTVPHRGAPLAANVTVPGSKSVANRALILAALASGESTLRGVPEGDDSEAMIACLAALGFALGRREDAVVVDGGVEHMRPGPLVLDARLAGTTSRFITALAALGPGPYTIDGLPPLRGRPMGPLHEALGQLGVMVDAADDAGRLPVTVSSSLGMGSSSAAAGPSSAAVVSLRGDVSSQFLSALMMIGPLLPGGLQLQLTTSLVSRSYLAITSAVMADFGVLGVEIGERMIRVPAGRYHPIDVTIEPDASSASYPLAAAAVVGGSATVVGLTATSVQGDARFADVLGDMGCHVRRDAGGTTVTRSGALRGIDIDMNDLSDLVPTLAVVAAFAESPTVIRGVGFIRHKESDRLNDLADELRKAGVDIDATADGLEIRPSVPRGARLATHHDHRLAMSFGVLGLRVPGVEIEDPTVTSKSWPGFWSSLEAW